MKYDDMLLADLRTYAMKIGVKSPTTYKKGELIERILEIENGQISPYSTKRGRPSIKRISQMTIDKIVDKGIDKERIIFILNKMKQLLEELEEELKN